IDLRWSLPGSAWGRGLGRPEHGRPYGNSKPGAVPLGHSTIHSLPFTVYPSLFTLHCLPFTHRSLLPGYVSGDFFVGCEPDTGPRFHIIDQAFENGHARPVAGDMGVHSQYEHCTFVIGSVEL